MNLTVHQILIGIALILAIIGLIKGSGQIIAVGVILICADLLAVGVMGWPAK